MDLRLRDKGVVITGSSQGISRACAQALAAEGSRVAIVARNRRRLNDAAELIRSKTGAEVHPICEYALSIYGPEHRIRPLVDELIQTVRQAAARVSSSASSDEGAIP